MLSVPGKVLCLVFLRRLHQTVDAWLLEEQAGFHPGRSCGEQIFVLRTIIEQSRVSTAAVDKFHRLY